MLLLIKNNISIYKFSFSNDLFYSFKLSIFFIKGIFGIILFIYHLFIILNFQSNLLNLYLYLIFFLKVF